MKEYIAPVAKNILLRSEISMLLDASNNYNDGTQHSNDRESIGCSIWDSED